MDIIFPYVNCNDKEWKIRYNKSFTIPSFSINQYRDNGLLKYLFRSIDKNMPFIENVFMIIQSKSQIPEWLNTNNVKIVYHKDYIPQLFLPTFNSNIIEMFFNEIKDLSEQFIITNDDIIFLKQQKSTNYFRDNRPVLKIQNINETEFEKLYGCHKASIKMFQELCNTKEMYKNWHLPSPILKSTMNTVWSFLKGKIYSNLIGSRIRKLTDVNWYLFEMYQIYKNITINDLELNTNGFIRIKNDTTIDEIDNIFDKSDVVCFNDSYANDDKNMRYIINRLDKIFNKKSKFEL
jgi:hypothetical protein